jgi:predicted RNA binding protein YcfA (HicA-like mRNA interferase family)
MPKTIRVLKNSLLKAGCVCENAKGSHTKWSHHLLVNKLILSGNDGADAKPYQEKQIADYLKEITEAQ